LPHPRQASNARARGASGPPAAPEARAQPSRTPPPRRRILPAAGKGDVEVEDLPLPAEQLAEAAFQEFDKNWEEAQTKAGGKPSLMKVSVLLLQHMRQHVPLPRRAGGRGPCSALSNRRRAPQARAAHKLSPGRAARCRTAAPAPPTLLGVAARRC
jgi:hypothetical protein